MRHSLLAALVGLVVLNSLSGAFAQAPPPPAAPGQQTKAQDYYSRLYDPAKVIYVRSFVYGLRYVPLRNNETAVLAKLRIGSSFPYVYLGSARFLDDNKLNVDIVDSIAVTASIAHADGRHLLIAKELTRGDQRLVLLDGQGRPRWRNQN